MSEANQDFNGCVPTFNLSMDKLVSEGVPLLFPVHKVASKRKPGMITNIRKQTVTSLLDIFNSHNQEQTEIFNVKKKLVADAIEAIYEYKKESEIKNTSTNNPSEQITLLSKESRCSSPMLGKTNYIYKTPSKRTTINEFESTENSRRSSSASKLNYSASESKFRTEDIAKFRRRSGFYK